jgi:molybdopterin molybdotransferase
MESFMISVSEARKKIEESVLAGPTVSVSLKEASGRILAEKIASPFDLPFFDNSAMDGYAVRAEETAGATQNDPSWFRLGEIISAGAQAEKEIRPGETFRIFTGAMMPRGADAVVKQEEILRREGQIGVTRPLKKGENIRFRGEEIRKGDLLLNPGEKISPAAVGFLASLGIRKIPVFSPPRVGILVTGSEIVTDPSEIRDGKILDSNSFSLTAALETLRLSPLFCRHSPDDPALLLDRVRESLAEVDFLLVTGGVSVGDFDFVKEAAEKAGVKEIFWKIKQKPGKPLFFGKTETEKFLFGLPGNPASALVCFYEYVRPALLRAMGAHDASLLSLNARLKNNFSQRTGLTHFLKGDVSSTPEGVFVEVLENQGSHMMTSFARANCLVVISGEKEEWRPGDEVQVHLLFS